MCFTESQNQKRPEIGEIWIKMLASVSGSIVTVVSTGLLL